MERTLTGFKLYFKDLCANEPVLRSDTLYSLLLDTFFKLGTIDNDLSGTNLNISSAFPFFDDYYFMPMPLDFMSVLPDSRYIPVNGTMHITHTLMEMYFSGNLKEASIFQSGNFLMEKQTAIRLDYPFYTDYELKLADKRISAIRFNENAGLYFFFDSHESQIFSALEFLKDEGIGANRKLGRGCFNFKKFELRLTFENPGKYLLLSLYHPTLEEVKNGYLKDSLMKWVLREKKPLFNSDRESKYFRIAKEGSYIRKKPEEDMGSMLKIFNPNKKLGTETTIYRSGKGFFLG